MFGLTQYEKNNDLFDAFKDFEKNFFGGDFSLNSCKTDIREEKDKYILEAELPGFNKEDIKVDLDGDCLILSAEHSEKNDEKDKDGKYIRRERSFGSYRRSFDVTGVNTNEISAEYKNGILMLNMPKKQLENTAARRLQIN